MGLQSPLREQCHAWTWEWQQFSDTAPWLFKEWIWPNTLETFRGARVLDCGCGGGHHLALIAPICSHATGVDLHTIDIARTHTACFSNITLQENDIAHMDLKQMFDIVYAIGVLHHTNDPDGAFHTIAKHCRPGGKVIVWVYAQEGNGLHRRCLEPLKHILLHHLPRTVVLWIAHILTLLLHFPIYTLYIFVPRRLGKMALPFYEYFENWRCLPYRRNLLNVFDKLNAPQTQFIPEAQIRSWFSPEEFTDVHISRYKGVSWRGSGTKR